MGESLTDCRTVRMVRMKNTLWSWILLATFVFGSLCVVNGCGTDNRNCSKGGTCSRSRNAPNERKFMVALKVLDSAEEQSKDAEIASDPKIDSEIPESPKSSARTHHPLGPQVPMQLFEDRHQGVQ